jgi:hypothetical protein
MLVLSWFVFDIVELTESYFAEVCWFKKWDNILAEDRKGIIFLEEYSKIKRVLKFLFEHFFQMCAVLKVEKFIFQAVHSRARDA